MQIPVKFFKKLGLPSEPVANAVYYIFDEDKEVVSTWVTDADGQAWQGAADGRSAYQIAVDNGFEGSQEEWLASLVGEVGGGGTITVATAHQSVLVSGAGTAEANGSWSETDTLNGKPSYRLAGAPLLVCFHDEFRWLIFDDDLGDTVYLAADGDEAYPWLASGWQAGAGAGEEPVPTVTQDPTPARLALTGLGLGAEVYQEDNGFFYKLVGDDASLEGSWLITQPAGLLSSTVVATDVGTKQALYTVPVGKICIVTNVVFRDPDGLAPAPYPGSTALGFNAIATDWLEETYAILDLRLPGTALVLGVTPANETVFIVTQGNAGDVFGLLFYDTSIEATITIDVFGYLVNAPE